MSATPWLVAIGGIGLYLWFKSKQTAPPPPSLGDDACALACKASGPYCIDGGASCRETNKILGAINPFTNSSDNWETERQRREKINDGLNTAPFFGSVPAIKNPAPGVTRTLTSSTLRYANGCEPYFGAPGWYKCKAGTQDMYKSAVGQGAGLDPSVFHVGEEDNLAPHAYPTALPLSAVYETSHVNKAALLTGAAGDASTSGDATRGWYVRGKLVKPGDPGKAPRAVVMQAFSEDAFISILTDDQAAELVDIFQDPRTVSTTYTVPCGVTSPGFQWNGSTWVRTPAGQSDSARPCAQPVNAQVAHFIGL